MKEVHEAAREILAAFSPMPEERVGLLEALGRYSSRDLLARSDAPPFDNSAMDGYALASAGVAGASVEQPIELPVHGESRAGVPAATPLVSGSAMRIFTGAPLPEGADAVVLQEDTVRVGASVQVREAPRVHENVRRRGTDLRAGECAIPAQTRVSAGEIALLASQEYASVPVFRRPRVAIVSTGDELRDIGEPARSGTIVNSNAYALAAQVREAGGEPWVLPTVPDRVEQVEHSLRIARSADVLVISGGVSVGDYDVVRDALQAAGIELAFWKIRMKPGKPVAFGRAGEVPVLGLPGNPVSAWVTFELFVRPGLRRMLGDPQPERARVKACLAAPLTRSAGRTEFARARLRVGEAGYTAELLPKQGSGSLPSLVAVDALVVLPATCERLEAGAAVEAIVLRAPTG